MVVGSTIGPIWPKYPVIVRARRIEPPPKPNCKRHPIQGAIFENRIQPSAGNHGTDGIAAGGWEAYFPGAWCGWFSLILTARWSTRAARA